MKQTYRHLLRLDEGLEACGPVPGGDLGGLVVEVALAFGVVIFNPFELLHLSRSRRCSVPVLLQDDGRRLLVLLVTGWGGDGHRQQRHRAAAGVLDESGRPLLHLLLLLWRRHHAREAAKALRRHGGHRRVGCKLFGALVAVEQHLNINTKAYGRETLTDWKETPLRHGVGRGEPAQRSVNNLPNLLNQRSQH